jgi:hypothetical protein
MMSSVQKSVIANIVQGYGNRASLNEPSRPFTPGDMPRHLIYGDDYNSTNRPGSSYKMNSVGKAIEEFSNQYNSTANTSASTQKRGGQNKDSNILEKLPDISRKLPKFG